MGMGGGGTPQVQSSDPRFREVGSIGDTPVASFNPSTPQIDALVNAAQPLLLGILQDPTTVASLFSSLAGPVPGAASFDNPFSQALAGPNLTSLLFGDSAGGLFGGGTNVGGSGALGFTGGFNPFAQPQPQQFEVPPVSKGGGGGGDASDTQGSEPLDREVAVDVVARQTGGPIDPAAINLVGEAGPEAIVPPNLGGGPTGTVLPNQTAANNALGNALQGQPASTAAPGQLQGPNLPQLGGANNQQQLGFPGPGGQDVRRLGPGAIIEENPLLPGPQQQQPNDGLLGGFLQNFFGNQAGSDFLTNLFQNGLPGFGQGEGENVFQSSLEDIATGNNGQGLADALSAQLRGNAGNIFGQLGSTIPSVFNTGAGVVGGGLAQRLNNDANVAIADALLRGQGNQINAAATGLGNQSQQAQNALGLGGLASGQQGQQAGLAQGLSGQALQQQLGLGQLAQNQQQFDSQFGLQQQNQLFNQLAGPIQQMLLAALSQATPIADQPIIAPQG